MSFVKRNYIDGETVITAENLNAIQDAIIQIVPNDVKQALLQIASKVAYIDDDGQDYYDALESALYPDATLVSISAVYTQSGAVYTNDTLDSLKNDLVVTALYDDSSTSTVTAYTLSGTLAEGTSTITVTYNGKTTTFTVNCTVKGWLYHFNQSLASSGSEDFEWQGTGNYSTGVDADGYSYWHKVTTEGTSSTDVGAIYANGLTNVPDLSGDFTISFWYKSVSNKKGQMFGAYKFTSASGDSSITGFGNPANVKSGYTVSAAKAAKAVTGFRTWFKSSDGTFEIRICGASATYGRNYDITAFPTGFDTTAWHHYAFTRKNGTIYVFIDGEVIFTIACSVALLFNSQASLGGLFNTVGQTTPANTSYGNYFDDLYISDWCKWDSDFDISAITY